MRGATASAVAFAARISHLAERDASAAAAADGSHAASLLALHPSSALSTAQTRWADAGAQAVQRALDGELRAAARVAVVGGGAVASAVVRGCAGSGGVVVVGGGIDAVAGARGKLEYCEVAGCAGVVAGCDVVVFGAEVVCADGACVVGAGVGAVVAVAKMAGVRCVAVVQSVKFGGEIYMAGAGKEGVEVLEGRFVDALWTENGRFQTAEAAAVAKAEGVS